MKKILSVAIALLLSAPYTAEAKKEMTLKDVLGKYFLIGAAVDTAIVRR